jgi:hypothetical protein
MIKKILLTTSVSVIVAVVLAFAGIIYLAFVGNPFVKKDLREEAQNYLDDNYPNFDYKVSDVRVGFAMEGGIYSVYIKGTSIKFYERFYGGVSKSTDPILQSLQFTIYKDIKDAVEGCSTENIRIILANVHISDTKKLTPALNFEEIPLDLSITLRERKDAFETTRDNMKAQIKTLFKCLNTNPSNTKYQFRDYIILKDNDYRKDVKATISFKNIQDGDFKSLEPLF